MTSVIIAPYTPYKVNDVGDGYYSFDLYADPCLAKCPACHMVTPYKTRAFLLGSPLVAYDFVRRNFNDLIEECKNDLSESEDSA